MPEDVSRMHWPQAFDAFDVGEFNPARIKVVAGNRLSLHHV